MKRSEMIELIIKGLKELDKENDGFSLYKDYANSVLNIVEENGMFPDTICWLATNEYSRLNETEICHDYDMQFMWEPEEIPDPNKICNPKGR